MRKILEKIKECYDKIKEKFEITLFSTSILIILLLLGVFCLYHFLKDSIDIFDKLINQYLIGYTLLSGIENITNFKKIYDKVLMKFIKVVYSLPIAGVIASYIDCKYVPIATFISFLVCFITELFALRKKDEIK